MSELTDLEQQLTDALRTRAASASPPTDAWERVVAGLTSDTDPSGGGGDVAIHIIHDTEPELPTKIERWRRWPIAVIGAAAAVLLLIVVLISRSDPDEENIFTEDLQEDLDPAPSEDLQEDLDPAPSEDLQEDLDPAPSEDLQAVGGPTLTEDIPPDLESGTIVTPVGNARWVRLSGDSSSVPAGEAIPWPSGFAIFERPYTRQEAMFAPVEILNSARLWVSADGIDWQLRAIPVPSDAVSARLSHSNGEYWLVSSSPLRFWHSINGDTWDEYDSSSRLTPVPAGFDNETSLFRESVVAEGDIALLSAGFIGGFPWADYVPGFTKARPCVERFREVEPGVFEMIGDGEEEEGGPCPSEPPLLRFEETVTGLRVFDHLTSDELGFIDGADLTHIAQIAQTDELYGQGVFVIKDGQVSPAEVPWPSGVLRGVEEWSSRVTLIGAQGWIYAYLQPLSEGPTELWRSDDGRSWTSLDPPEALADLGQGSGVRFSAVPGGPLVASSHTGAWETTDGVTWIAARGQLPDTPPPAPPPGGTTLVRLASGWFANDGSRASSTDGDGWWFYLGDEWFSLDEVGIEGAPDLSGGGVGSTAVGNITMFYTANSNLFGEARNMWIVSIEPD